MARRPMDWPGPVRVKELAGALALLPIAEVRQYADRMLTRLVIAKVILEDRDPEAAEAWFADLARKAHASMDETVPRRRRVPS